MNLQLHTLGEHVQQLQKHGLLTDPTMAIPMPERTVSLVSCDSQSVVPGTLFICKGAHFKEEYLQEAIRKGALAYIAAAPYENVPAPCIPVTDVRHAMALLADYYYNHPSHRLNVVGITGTKGKSSTSYYLKYIFDEFMSATGGKESGVLGSIDTYDGVERFESHLTTPEPLDLERHFANAVGAGLGYMTMEVSSQALKYDRVFGVEFAVACFLNIGYDHISPVEHPDFEDYFQSKLRIFEQADVGCVNLDTERTDEVLSAARACKRIISFSRKDPSATVFADQVRKQGNDILFRVRTPRYLRQFRLTMPGLFNVENALAAIAVCEALAIPEQHIFIGLQKARVPGRMEIYANADDSVIAIVDYAHNRLSFEKLFESVLAEYPDRRIVTVFGCPGKKALDRRRDLGEISGKYSDLVILTEEDSGEEDTESICREIAAHVEAQNCSYLILPDRGEAIRQAILSCQEPSVILITGKGAETRQKRGLAYIDCPSDVQYSKESLHEYDVTHGLDGLEKARSFLYALPATCRYTGKTVVVKYGGSAIGATDTILQDAAALTKVGARVVLVHGGGKAITGLLDKLGVETHFVDGYRYTDETVLGVAEMALSAQVNKAIVGALSELGTPAVGISGRDGNLLAAQIKNPALGKVGEITCVDTHVLSTLLNGGFLPVVSPIAQGAQGALNCNADDAARTIAEALQADALIFLTDTDGVLVDSHNAATVISHIDLERGRELLDNGLIAGGMAPKVRNCLQAVERGVGKVVILNGTVEHALLLETISQKPLGTTMTKD